MDDIHTITERFFRAANLMQRSHHNGENPFGGSLRGQGRVLTMLRIKPEIGQKELGFLLGMRNQSLSELLYKMEKAGYIERTQSQADRRAVDIKLTPLGASAAEVADAQLRNSDRLLACLSEEERKQLDDFLGRIIQSLESDEGTSGPSWRSSPTARFVYDAKDEILRRGKGMFDAARGRQDGPSEA